jgi:hypothetical protein
MKTNRSSSEKNVAPNFTSACVEQCRKLAAHLATVREGLIAEFSESYEISERLLQLAVKEAEAIAWETEYPHLVFPALAMEKVRVAANWDERQRAIRRVNPAVAFAA